MLTLNGAVDALPAALEAVTTQPVTDVAPTLAVPPMVLPESVRPAGSEQPERVFVGNGNPVVTKEFDAATPTVNDMFPIAPIVGAWLTTSVNDCVASGATPLVATMLSG